MLRHDRGAFSRSEAAYRSLFKDFTIESFTTFTINVGTAGALETGPVRAELHEMQERALTSPRPIVLWCSQALVYGLLALFTGLFVYCAVLRVSIPMSLNGLKAK